MKSFDYIIAGAGAAGLTLTHLLLGLKDSKKTILVIDKDDKTKNDRTWSFWEKEQNLFEHLVHKKWQKAIVKGKSFDHTYEIAPYEYKMIRSEDFYNALVPEIKSNRNVTWLTADVLNFDHEGTVNTSEGTFVGERVFNSTINYEQLNYKGANNVLQHFKGWVIKTKAPTFNVDTVHYMDFTPDQEGDCRFGYVLPFGTNEALVEYTVFNKTLLDDNGYDERLKAYIEHLNIAEYEIIETEKGVIPMTDYRFQLQESEHLYNIGILGGFAKGSTGYSFLRAQHILTQMVKNISNGNQLMQDLPYQKERFKKYDATLLDVLAKGKYTGEQIFTNLFEKNGAHQVFKFLDEQTSLAEEIKIMSSTPILDFGMAFIKQMTK